MKTTSLIKPAVFTLLALSITSVYADMTQDANAAQQAAVVAPAMSDDSVTKEVQAKMAEQMPAMHLEVSTKDGVVTLVGIMDSQAQADSAMAMAKTVKGVKDVKSSMQVKK